MKDNEQARMNRRFAIMSLLQAIAILICVVLSIQYFGRKAQDEKPSVALILASAKETPGWPRDISLGLQAACDQLDYNVYIEDNISTEGQSLREVTEKLVHRGVKHIFLANPGYQQELEYLAKKYPLVNFYANSVGQSVSYEMINYSVRYYEVRYMAGVLAGLHTQSGIVGYVAPFPAAETRRDLNAFALGVQSVRPDAKIRVRWTEYWLNNKREEECIYGLKHEGADVITYFSASQHAAEEAQKLGVDYIDFHHASSRLPSRCLAAIETDWQKIFVELLRQNLQRDSHTIYWHGMLDGVVSLRLSNKLLPKETAMVIGTRQKIYAGFPVFSGRITDQYGVLRCMEGEALDGTALRQMSWLVKGVDIIESR